MGILFTEKISTLCFILIYYIQGAIGSLVTTIIPTLLVERGTEFSKVSIITMPVLLVSVKVLFAPLVDYYYLTCLGKRKTYIVLIYYIMSICTILLAFNLQ
jgi:PAT family acetyl-CoA transporter-like MFS transporter 1